MKRFFLILTVGVLTFSLLGCSALMDPDTQSSQLGAYKEEEEREVIPARHYISLIFYEDMDTNPLTTNNSENHELLKLVYSPLIRLNGSLVAEYILAESILIEGTSVRIGLKKDLKFSDGSAITAEDAAASYRTVQKTPDSPYYGRLTNVTRIQVVDDRTLLLTLREADTDFVNNLDIPIMPKSGTAASGPYQFSEKNGKLVLIPNPHHYVQPGIATIYLQHPANEQERQNMFSVGLLDVYFTSVESDLTFSGGKDYHVQTYAGDNLLYLGINCTHPLRSDAGARTFLNSLLEREKLADTVLLGQARETAYPFQSDWYKAEGLIHEKNPSDLAKKEQAAALGLNLTENALLDATGAQITFSLLVSEGSTVHQDTARAVADSFALSGIKINIESVPRTDYELRLQTGQYELYLGETKTGRTLNTVLYAAGSTLNYSGVLFPELEAAAAQYRAGTLSLTEFAGVFDTYTPVIPLAYRRGVLFVAKDIGDFQATGTWSLYGDITKLITK
ncbi:MAG: ABC transporter substrate-binding protein, partial [Clostridia bacterium]|nr:ABC transporter substrate-binding protein [Clostridia bacterium]